MSVWGWLNSTLFLSVALMAIISHLKAMMTDPGAVPPDAKPIIDPEIESGNSVDINGEANGKGENPPSRSRVPTRMCRRCKAFKPPRAHHCR